ncbi:hypothetical protein W911_06295 [Hyphomicrobium nitrativorans NL23]|uniref:Uncharacterized protein n=1 Tax=Hyphomicrobium nitrativorans NL23 TaxID=1029756 RepID=V5SIX4_9HYPH|nr:hypothetical protein W911_06295 [Hyphomicrobium nitrativorans NL23]
MNLEKKTEQLSLPRKKKGRLRDTEPAIHP